MKNLDLHNLPTLQVIYLAPKNSPIIAKIVIHNKKNLESIVAKLIEQYLFFIGD